MKTLTKSQLNVKYSQEIHDYSCNDFFDFVLQSYQMSSSPSTTAEGWIKEMTKETRKEFILYIQDKIFNLSELEIGLYEHYRAFSRLTTLTLNLL